MHTGKPAGAQPERNLGKRVVMEMIHGLQGHIVTCNIFFFHHMLLAERSFKKIKNVWNNAQEQALELPNALTKAKDRVKFSSKYAFTEMHTIVPFCAKKN